MPGPFDRYETPWYAARIVAERGWTKVTDFVTAETEGAMLDEVDRIVATTPNDADIVIFYGRVSHPLQAAFDE
jgi:hypothetical protein